MDVIHEPSSCSVSARCLAGLLEQVLTDARVATRLRHAETSVAFRLRATGESVALLLDREVPQVRLDEPAEVVVELDDHQAGDFANGLLELPAEIVAGEVQVSGPVRRFMAIEPVLRHHLRGMSNVADGTRPAPSAGGTGRAIDPDLLAIQTLGLRKAFAGNQVLDGLGIEIPEGMVSVVLGPSGTGKSVLLQHIIGLLAPDSGEVVIRGRSLRKMRRADLLQLRSEIGVMFQDGALFSAMNVFDNVAFPLRQHTDLRDEEVREVVEEHLDNVGLLHAATRMPNELSGGMRKRVGLARALVLSPGIVLCDEPDSGLDPVRTALLGDLLRDQHAVHGGTMVVVTHNIALARRICDHLSVVWRGKVLESGLAEDVFSSQTPFIRQFLAGASEGPLGMDV